MKIGQRIKDLRMASGLTQEDLAVRADLTKGFISQLERDITSISVESLVLLLEALDEDPGKFFSEAVEKKIGWKKEERISEEQGVRSFEYLITGTRKKSMEPVMLTLAKGEQIGKPAHPADEFGYVIAGKIEVRLGKMLTRLGEGECFYFKADKQHSIKNSGELQAQVLWITSPPAF